MAANFADPGEPVRIPITDASTAQRAARDIQGRGHTAWVSRISIIHGRGIGM